MAFYPEPYFARIFWMAPERWNVIRDSEWREDLRAAHALTFAKLPPKTRAVLALPAKDLKRLVAGRTAILTVRDP
jgi:hypothetical protein